MVGCLRLRVIYRQIYVSENAKLFFLNTFQKSSWVNHSFKFSNLKSNFSEFKAIFHVKQRLGFIIFQ